MSDPTKIFVYICSHCRRGFLEELQILEHQSHFHALHQMDPEVDEHDGAPWSGDNIEVGRTAVWEPYSPRHRENLTVTAVEGGRVTSTSSDGRESWNDASRFVEAVWPGVPMTRAERVRIIVAERELDLGVTDMQHGDDTELLILGVVETRKLARRQELWMREINSALAKLTELADTDIPF
jgi:hypothetical protein